jgi:hypothetical protein
MFFEIKVLCLLVDIGTAIQGNAYKETWIQDELYMHFIPIYGFVGDL